MAEHDFSEGLSTCPACGGEFEPVPVGLHRVERCGTCGGLWLDERSLEQILSIDHRVLTQRNDASHLDTRQSKKSKCPRCGGTLIKITNLRANVATDSCSVCYGIFLDSGELDAFDHPGLTVRLTQILRRLIGKH